MITIQTKYLNEDLRKRYAEMLENALESIEDEVCYECRPSKICTNYCPYFRAKRDLYDEANYLMEVDK